MPQLLRLHLKRVFGTLPRLFLGGMIPIVLALAALLLSRSVFQTNRTLIAPVAIINYDGKADLDFMLPYFSDVDAASGFAFVEQTEAEAFANLADGQVCAVMEFPPNMLSGIIHGENTPAILYLPKKSSLAALLLSKFAKAGITTLGSAQASVYSAFDLSDTYGLGNDVDAIATDINLSCLQYILARDSLFSVRSLSATGPLAILPYFAASLFFVLLLFLSSGFGNYLCFDEKNVFTAQLKRIGIGPIRSGLCLFLPLFLVESLFTFSLYFIFTAIAGSQKFGLPDFGSFAVSRSALLYLLLLSLCISFYIFFSFRLLSETGRGILFFLFSGLFMLFIAGGFLPYAFLPAFFQKLTPFFPVSGCLLAFRHLLGDGLLTSDYRNIGIYCAVLLFLCLCTGFLQRKEANT